MTFCTFHSSSPSNAPSWGLLFWRLLVFFSSPSLINASVSPGSTHSGAHSPPERERESAFSGRRSAERTHRGGARFKALMLLRLETLRTLQTCTQWEYLSSWHTFSTAASPAPPATGTMTRTMSRSRWTSRWVGHKLVWSQFGRLCGRSWPQRRRTAALRCRALIIYLPLCAFNVVFDQWGLTSGVCHGLL